ncbi:MAG: hypothetical protein LC781_05180 [Actinobacteria bacterium]|nr:hypothetical protein [Actinomycetota bacterium]
MNAQDITNKAQEISRRRQRAEAELYRPDGTPFYGPAEHQERLSAIVEDRDRAAEELAREADELVEARRAEAEARPTSYSAASRF